MGRLRKFKLNNAGATLVELIVAFALMSIFAAGITTIFTAVVRVYEQSKDLDYAMQVSDTLLDRAAGELQDAQADYYGTECTLSIRAEEAGFCDRNGIESTLSCKDGNLVQEYYDESGTETDSFSFDKSVLMGYTVEDMTFTCPAGYDDNVVCIALTIRRTEDSYSYTSTRYVRCFNFTEDDFDRITEF